MADVRRLRGRFDLRLMVFHAFTIHRLFGTPGAEGKSVELTVAIESSDYDTLSLITLSFLFQPLFRFRVYRACLRSPLRMSAPFSVKSAKSRVVVAGDAPVIVL